MLLSALLLTACGSGGNGGVGGDGGIGGDGGASGSSGAGTPPATAATPSLTFVSVKTFRFVWTDVDDATHYKLLEDPDAGSGFSQVGSDIAQGNQTLDHIVPLYARINAKYILQTCNDVGCTDSESLSVGAELGASIGYFKASNTEADDGVDEAVSLSAEGDTLAVGAVFEDSNATGVNRNQADNSASGAGAVYVFARSGSTWSQEAYLKASNPEQIPGRSYRRWAQSYHDRDAETLALYADAGADAAKSLKSDNRVR